MKKKLISILLVFAFAFACLAPAAFAAEGEEQEEFSYVALGDSITAGIGLPSSTLEVDETGLYIVRPNFTGYPDDCYVAVVADGLGLDREHALNIGLPGAESPTLRELVETGAAVTRMPYSLPELEDYIRNADVISISIGMNDASTHMFDLLYETCSTNLYPLTTYITDGTLATPSPENIFKILKAALSIDMSVSEFYTLTRTLLDGMQEVCDNGLATIQANLPQTIDRIRELNPDARILLIGYYNGLPVSRTWTRFTRDLNAYAEALAAEKGIDFVPITKTRISPDAHPTAAGHAYIGRQILRVLGSE